MADLVYRRTIPSDDPLLGRNIEHDPRSRAFRSPLLGADVEIFSVRHRVNVPFMDQRVGCCTCCNQVNMIASDQIWSTLPEKLRLALEANPDEVAEDWYRQVTREDEFDGAWEPDDTGSSGTSASKVTVERGYASGYLNGYTVDEARQLIQLGTIGVGSWWYSSFDRPASDGHVAITSSATRRGGHQYTGVERDEENDRWVFRNSWSQNWGHQGEFWYDSATLDRLLREDGDVIQLVPRDLPSPEPDWDRMLYETAAPWAYGRFFSKLTKAGKASEAFKLWAEKRGFRAGQA